MSVLVAQNINWNWDCRSPNKVKRAVSPVIEAPMPKTQWARVINCVESFFARLFVARIVLRSLISRVFIILRNRVSILKLNTLIIVDRISGSSASTVLQVDSNLPYPSNSNSSIEQPTIAFEIKKQMFGWEWRCWSHQDFALLPTKLFRKMLPR